MSTSDDEEIPGREIAYRLFAAEYDDATLSHTESDEERAPNYVVSPTGARLNRLFVVGTLTEVTSVNDEMLRARVVDPTGAFVVYAGQYQPDELATLESLEAPAFVAVTGKARTFQPDDSDQVYTSIRPESIATVDADTRDRWVVSAAEQTVERIGTYAGAAKLEASGGDLAEALLEADVETGLAAGIPLAQDHYGTTPSYLGALRDCAIEAVEVVANERDQVSGLDVSPDDSTGDGTTFDSVAAYAGVDGTELEAEATGVVHSNAAESADRGDGEDVLESDSESATDSAPEAEANSSVVGTATAGGSASNADPSEDVSPTTVESGVDSGTESTESVSSAESESEHGSEPSLETDSDADATQTDEPGDDDSPADDEGVSEEFDAADGMYEMDDEERERLEAEFGTEFTTGSEVDDPGEAEIAVPDDAEVEDADGAEPSTATAEADATGESDDLGAPPQSRLEEDDDSTDGTALDADEGAESTASSDDAEADTGDDADVDSSDTESTASSDDGVADEGVGDGESGSEPSRDDESEADESETDGSETDAPTEDVDLQERVVETMGDLDDGDGADRAAVVETVVDETGVSADDVEDAIQDALMGGRCYEPDDGTLKPI
ncbi:hypothetical protein AB7C87_00015 [Natrarchaeobius sp. A-rgal3]|uniref:hypothetical protein n=1 Tax=Natrarchaeobius versutus TaxID=1679078 RepID=UPI00350EC46B